jgi:hypothetical protein
MVGASSDLAPLSPQNQGAALAQLSQSGVATIRLPLEWNRVEPRPGKFSWRADDAAVNAACAQGLEVVLVLGPVAAWAVDPALGIPPDQVCFSLPRSDRLWERYVRQAATHFRGRVKSWQVREQPNARNFRGATSEYLHLFTLASRALRAVDPSATLILPESVALDSAGLQRRLPPPVGNAWEIWGAYLPSPLDLSASALALSVMTGEVMPAASRRPIWVVGAEGGLSADTWVQGYLLAAAFELPRYYVPADTVSAQWAPALSRLQYVGWLRLGPEVWAFAFQDQEGPAVVAWSRADIRLPASALAPVADLQQVLRVAPLGGVPGSAVESGGPEPMLLLGPRPALLRGLDASRAHPGPPTRADVLAARPGPDPSALPAVSVDYGRAEQPEQGLFNRSLRALPGGAVREEPHPERPALGTNLRPLPAGSGLDSPWIYFDVDDRWLYFAQGKTPVAITVEYEASRTGKERIGFNLYYDAITGYHATPWHWVEAGEGWRTYRFVLEDVSFTNRNGYDFRINAKGSKQDLWVASVRVEKLARDHQAAVSAAPRSSCSPCKSAVRSIPSSAGSRTLTSPSPAS